MKQIGVGAYLQSRWRQRWGNSAVLRGLQCRNVHVMLLGAQSPVREPRKLCRCSSTQAGKLVQPSVNFPVPQSYQPASHVRCSIRLQPACEPNRWPSPFHQHTAPPVIDDKHGCIHACDCRMSRRRIVSTQNSRGTWNSRLVGGLDHLGSPKSFVLTADCGAEKQQ